MPALDLLLKMQASHTHMALVIDEYGGTDGLVSIEDVMESIVGDIEDEHDEDETPELHASEDGGFIAEARAPLDAVSEAVGFDFASLGEAEGVDTIGGLVTAAAGRVPDRGEILKGPGQFEFEVLDADPRRVKRLKIRPLPPRPQAGDSHTRITAKRKRDLRLKRHPNVHFHCTPIHAASLNQIESRFSIPSGPSLNSRHIEVSSSAHNEDAQPFACTERQFHQERLSRASPISHCERQRSRASRLHRRQRGSAQFQLTVSFKLSEPDDGAVSDRLSLQLPPPG